MRAVRGGKKHKTIIQEWCSRGDLEKLLRRKRRKGMRLLQETTVWTVLSQIVNAVAYLHENRILHRDLKTSNCLVMKDNTVKIGDFGVSREVCDFGFSLEAAGDSSMLTLAMSEASFNAALDAGRTLCGSAQNLPPEVCYGHPHGSHSDIYQVGLILYELCTLVPPFMASNVLTMALKIVAGRFERLPLQYSIIVRNLTRRLMHGDPTQRPDAYELLYSALSAIRTEGGIKRTERTRRYASPEDDKTRDIFRVLATEEKERYLLRQLESLDW
eukprot:GEMP01071681.1.p1 GENE.GEMP01071681.1~~GEMP01071681.1.p1  ORF type:complete len:272 (+),score=48.67 GEMP01071681.1:84-899(+)